MSAEEEANTVKLWTVMCLGLGLVLPLWPITLPLFWYLAYRSYKAGVPPRVSLQELEQAKRLLAEGAITSEEFESVKRRSVIRH